MSDSLFPTSPSLSFLYPDVLQPSESLSEQFAKTFILQFPSSPPRKCIGSGIEPHDQHYWPLY